MPERTCTGLDHARAECKRNHGCVSRRSEDEKNLIHHSTWEGGGRRKNLASNAFACMIKPVSPHAIVERIDAGSQQRVINHAGDSIKVVLSTMTRKTSWSAAQPPNLRSGLTASQIRLYPIHRQTPSSKWLYAPRQAYGLQRYVIVSQQIALVYDQILISEGFLHGFAKFFR